MSKTKPYNFNEYSIIEISEFLEENNYRTKLIEKSNNYYRLNILDTKISIDVPFRSTNLDGVIGEIRFEDYPKDDNYETDKKLFEKLKRRFGIDIIKRTDFVKDELKIEAFIKNND